MMICAEWTQLTLLPRRRTRLLGLICRCGCRNTERYGKTGNKKVLLVLQHCCKTSRKAMLRVLPTLNRAKKFTTNSPISFILNFKSRDMSHDHDYTFGTKRPQDIHLRKILSFNSWYPSERYCKTNIFFSAISVKLRIKRIEHK